MTGGANSKRAERGSGGPDLQEVASTWSPTTARWPTPVVRDDGKTPEAHLAMKKRMGERDGTGANRTAITSLTVLVQQWQTPATDSFRSRGGERKDEQGLDQQARNWPTPMTRDHRSGEAVKSDEELWGTKGRPLERVAATWEHPDHTASPGPTIAGGALSSTDSPSSNQPSVKRKLNPIFVEALMRWPTGWTDFGCSATESTQWRQRMRGYVLMLVTARTASERQGSLL